MPETVEIPQIDVQGMALLLGFFIPLVVAAITKKYSAPWVKSVTNVVAVVIVSVVTLVVQNNGDVTVYEVINVVIATFVASVAAYKGLWKSLNVGNIAPQAGIGAAVRQVEEPGAYDTP
jgi:hypothetical protein